MDRMKPWILFCASLLCGAAFAEGGVPKAPLSKACQTVMTACEGAGYHKGGHKEHKGLWKDCVAPILDGQTIAGVSVSPDDVKACAAKRPTDRG
jgi:hypothetical protein